MKLKFIAIGLVVLFIAGLTVTVNIQQTQIKKKDAENARLQFNQLELSKENTELTSLTLREKEVIGRYKIENVKYIKCKHQSNQKKENSFLPYLP